MSGAGEIDESSVLRYGQIVALHFFDDENGFISADGHVKKHVQMRGYEKYYSASYATKNETKLLNKDDFSNCLFQIYPKVVNTQKTKINREIEAYKRQKLKEDDSNELTLEKLQMLKFNVENDKKKQELINNQATPSGRQQNFGGAAAAAAAAAEDEEEDRDVLMKRISKYQVTLQNEFKYNVDTFENNKNIPLTYTQPFQLLHLNSSKFLACNFLESKHEKENYEITLEEQCSDSTLFNILPAFKYQKDSSLTINEGDCVWIVRAIPFNNKTIHLHCSMELSEMKRKTLQQKQLVNTNFQNASMAMRSDPNAGGTAAATAGGKAQSNNSREAQSQGGRPNANAKLVIDKREINGCLEQATTLKFKIYQNVSETKSKYLNCGDAIWLHHSEANSALSVIRKERGTTRYTFTSIHIESWISKENLDLFVGQTKENTSFEDYSGNTFGLWVIENVDFKKGGQVEYGAGYRLKHMSTGYYLTVVDENAMMMKQKFEDLKKVQEELEKKKSTKNTKQLGPMRYETNPTEADEDKSDESDNDVVVTGDGNDNDYNLESESPTRKSTARGGRLRGIAEEDAENARSDGERSVLGDEYGGDETEQMRVAAAAEDKKKNNKKKKKTKGLAEKEAELEVLRGKIAKKWKLALTTNAKDEFTLFQFFALGTSQSIYEQFVEQGNFVFIRNMHSNQWVDVLNLLHPSSVAASMAQEGGGGNATGNAAAAAAAGAANANPNAGGASDIPAQVKHFESKKQLSEFNQDESTSAFSPLRITLKQDQAENQVFKVFQISSNEVWEAKFVISCSNVLLKFLLNQKELNEMCNQGDEISIRSAKQKIKTSRHCIQSINDFCCNKLLNYQPDQKLGVPNFRRQKLLREQYYIDFLVKILEDLLPKAELELWIEYKRIMDKEKLEKERENAELIGSSESSEDDDDDEEEEGQQVGGGNTKVLMGGGSPQKQGTSMLPPTKKDSKKKKKKGMQKGAKLSKQSAKKDHALYLKEKVDMAKDIYQLLIALCKNNSANEEYVFKLIPFFQIQCKYLPEAIDCLIQLVSNNERILMALSENLKIEFDYEKREDMEAGTAVVPSKPVKIIINLYDESSQETAYGDGKIAFRQHEKITSKPINLIVFFMNLIWDENSLQKSNYLKFLRSISRFSNKGISLNQENIFKIYKNYSKNRNVIRYDQYFKSGSIKLPDNTQDKRIFEYDVSEQLKFYSELSFGRNFLWRQELIKHFSNYYLLQNIWSQGDLKEYPILRSCFCQLAMSLYIDHEPLQRMQVPNFCRLFDSIGEFEDVKVFDEEKNQENEIVMYKALIGNLENYLRQVSEKIALLISIPLSKDKLAFKATKKEANILHDPLLLISMELLSLLVELNLYGSLDSTSSYQNLTPYLFNILVYDLKNLENFTSCACTLEEQNKNRKDEKQKKKNPAAMLLNFSKLNLKNLKNVASGIKNVAGSVTGLKKEKEDDVDYELDSQELANPLEQSKLYDNHIMRGQIKLHNALEEMNFSDSSGYLTEIKVKIKVLDVLERFMDLRQNYLMTNMLKFFKDQIGNTINTADPIEAKKQITEIIRNNLKGFLPNIPLTGNDDVDKIFQPKESNNLLKDLTKFKIGGSKTKEPPVQEKFMSYIKDSQFIHYQDINNLLSAAFEETKEMKEPKEVFEDPVTTCLPQLFSSFLINYDENLEKRLLKIMIRMYNQRSDLLDNIQKIQIIFDAQTNRLFRALEEILMRLNKLVEQCEVWFSTLAKNEFKDHQIRFLIELLENLNNGFFKSIAQPDGRILLLEQSIPRYEQRVNKEKQKIYQYLKVYEPILSLLKEGMHHFNSFILDQTYPADKKPHLIRLFELVYEFLYHFTTNDKDNQAIIQKAYPLIAEYLKYDLGQMRVICAIYKDNAELLNNSVDKKFIDTFLDLIETEGKQIHFLDIFSTILKCKNKYIFDNQLLVLNTFLPQKAIGEKEYNLLYANGSTSKSFRFYLEDVCKSLTPERLNSKLLEVDYRDTYRDEPFIYHIKVLNLLIETCSISTKTTESNDGSAGATSMSQSHHHRTNTEESVTFNNNNNIESNRNASNRVGVIREKDIVLKDVKGHNEFGDFENSGDEEVDDEKDDQAAGAGDEADEEFDGEDGENPKRMTKEQRKDERRKARMQRLLQRCKLDPAFADSKFNISIARLKRNFRVFDLLQMLNMEDSFATWQKFSNQMNKKPEMAIKLKDTEGKQGIFEEALNDKDEIERKRQIEEQKKKFLSANHYQDEAYKEQQRMFKDGMSILKPHLLNFLRKVHISSETVISAASDMIVQQKEIASFFDKESIKIGCLVSGFFSPDYVNYIFDGLVPFLYDYFKKFVERGPHNSHIQDDEERRDDKQLDLLLDKILNKLPLFQPYLTPIQRQRMVVLAKTVRGLYFKVTFGDATLPLQSPNKLSPLKKLGLSPKKESNVESINGVGGGVGVVSSKGLAFNFQRGQTINEIQPQVDGASDLGDDDDKTNLLQNNKNPKVKGKLNVLKMMSRMVTSQKQSSTETAERNWRIFKEILKEDNRVKEQVSNEKIVLAEAIVRVKSIIKPEFAKDLVLKPDMFKLIKKFIKFLQYAPEDPSNKETIISLLAVLKEVIESKGLEQNRKSGSGGAAAAADLDEADEEKQAEKRVKIQNMFDQLGAMKMVLTVLSQSNSNLDNELIINYLSFANSLLEGGNNSIQITIFNFFMSYQKSEVIFHRFNSIVRRQIRAIEHRKLGGNSNFQGDSEEENSQMIELLEMVLRFLQLCVEGHYIDLQNYLRKQENSRNNYDMVQAVADLLKAYYYGDRTQKMYDNMIFCLDTLSEFVQGPCKDNQEAVSDSKFFDIASDLFAKRQKTQEEKLARIELKKSWKQEAKVYTNLEEQYRNSRDEPLTPWMISRLQNKVLILVLSLLESREVKHNCDIIKRIMRNLPTYLLQRHLIKAYRRFKDYYGNNFNRSSLSHMEKDPREESDQPFFKQLCKDKKHVNQYLECILQNGFQIYFLLSYYIESDSKLGGEMVKFFKNYEKKILNNEKGELEDLLTGDNIVGQLISFARLLIESVLKEIDNVKKKTVDAVLSLQAAGADKQDPAKQAARSQILKEGMNFFAQNSAHIDIVRNDQLELVYFIKLPATNCMPKEKKTDFHEVCDRSNIKTKQLALVKEAPDLIEICKHEYKLKILFSSNKFLALFANYVKLWKDLSFFISLVLNIFIMGSFNTPQGADWYMRMTDYNLFNDPSYTQEQTDSLFRVLGIAMIVCSNFVLLFFLFKSVPLILSKAMSQGIQLKDYRSFIGKIYVLLIKLVQIMFIFLQDVEVLYYFAYGALAVIGTVVHPFFFTFHLTAILMRYPTLKNVVMSIYLPRKQLLLTFLLFVVLEYCFSVWGYAQFYEEYAGTCESLLYCFLTTFDQTFKPNGGVGGYFAGNKLQSDVSNNTAKYSLVRFFFDQIFQYVMLNIMINIVVGIIIDTFGVLREQSNERSQDMNNFCYICGIEKTTFDRKSDSGKGFQKHIKFNHYMWNYVNFILYLEWKERSEYTGIESYVDDLLKQNDTYWMPFKLAREIGDGEDEDDEDNFQQLLHIEKKQTGLLKQVNNLVESIKDLSKEKKERRDNKK